MHTLCCDWYYRLRRGLGILLWVVALGGCATTPRIDPMASFHDAQPNSLLVVPIVNNSVDVQAPTSVLTTLPRVLAEKGYYVFPVNTVKTLLEFEGLYEPAEIHATPPDQLADLFGADAILYVTIHEWTAQYLLVQTTTVIDFEYRIVHRDGTPLWSARKHLTYRPDSGSTGNNLSSLIASAITAAFERADPHYLPLTRQANREVFYTDTTALPPGPYARNYEQYYQNIEEKYGNLETDGRAPEPASRSEQGNFGSDDQRPDSSNRQAR